MLLYNVSEEYILRTWAIETLIKKTKTGFNFLLMKLGIQVKEDEPISTISDDELVELYRKQK